MSFFILSASFLLTDLCCFFRAKDKAPENVSDTHQRDAVELVILRGQIYGLEQEVRDLQARVEEEQRKRQSIEYSYGKL